VSLQLVLMTVGGATLLILGALVWTHVQHQSAIERLDDRIAHLLAGVSLLTDTTEGALRDVATEIHRLAATPETSRPRPRAATQRRIAGAARRGTTVQDIAATEEMSEGEVRLRLQLEKAHKERLNNYASMR
jgi:DNA-binding NarL/FixJ family response regulator